MDSFKSLLSPLSGSLATSGLLDGAKLVLIGGTVETARRASSSAWNSFINSFFLTAHFSEEDYPYDWLLHWLQKQPAWSRSREFEATTCTITANGNTNRRGAQGDEFEDELEESSDEDDGRSKLKVVFQPTYETTHTIYYNGHWLRIRRSKKTDGSELQMLSISVVARSNGILKQLVLEAKREYEKEAVHRVQIYFADSHGGWRWTDSRHKRPLSSIVLGAGVKEMLLGDAKDFLRSEKWYADRGIPYRRGYLLYGAPGSGKSSLIHALAGELALDIYVVSLSASWMNDSTLTNLMGRVPARSILLLEDLDAAFTHSTSRDTESNGSPDKKDGPKTKEEEEKEKKKESISDQNTLSLSGLLNSLDSIQASEGRILFATTNHLERLDPALSRPGRMDVWVEFKNASKHQAEGLFRNFFPAAEEDIDVVTVSEPLPSSTSDGIPKTPAPAPTSTDPTPVSTPSAITSHEAAPTLEQASALNAERLTPARLAELAKTFAESIPEEEFSVAALQGYLLKNKTRPEAAALDAGKWVIAERELRERLAREKEERERKEREAREKRRREREERERKEKEEKERKEKEEREKKEAEEKTKLEAEEKTKREQEEKEKAASAEKAASEATQPASRAESVAPSEEFEKVD